MNIATRPTTLNLRQSLTCAALAVSTTLGIFSVIATEMPPLLSDLYLVAGNNRDVLCAQSTRIRHEELTREHSAI